MKGHNFNHVLSRRNTIRNEKCEARIDEKEEEEIRPPTTAPAHLLLDYEIVARIVRSGGGGLRKQKI